MVTLPALCADGVDGVALAAVAGVEDDDVVVVVVVAADSADDAVGFAQASNEIVAGG